MKKLLSLLLICLILFACDEENLPLPAPNTRFVHEIMDCAFGGPEMNCSEFVEFIDSERADFLIGGGDIIERTTYSQNGNRIVLNTNFTNLSTITFEIQTDSTLLRLDNQTVWIRED